MKKIIYSVALLALMASCTKEEIPSQVTDNKGITLSSLKIDDVKTKGEGLANGSKVGLIYPLAELIH